MEHGKSCCRKAYAKINLTLDVGEERPDGFHDVTMIMQSIALWDEVTMQLRSDGEIHLSCNLPYLVRGEKNIAYRAARLFLTSCGRTEGVDIRLFKKIPVAAGLAGGSTDAAAVLKGLNALLQTGLSVRQMCRLGEQLGSDIPFCLIGGTCLATGRGEKIRRIEAMPEGYLVLVKPDFGISTPWAYAHFDPQAVQRRPDVEAMHRAIRSGRLSAVGDEMVNLLEPAALSEYPILSTIKEELRRQGAAGVLMSGSGPTVYGLFERPEAAEAAAAVCREKYPASYTVLHCPLQNPMQKKTRKSV